MANDSTLAANELAILIDFWEQPDHVPALMVPHAIEFIKNRNEIGYIVLASYQVTVDIHDSTIWDANHRILFEETSPLNIQYLTNLANYQLLHIEDDPNQVIMQTDHIIQNYVFENKYQIAMNYFFELEWFLSLHPQIDTLWFFGAGWDKCVKVRELGWEHMKQLTGKKLLTNSNCIGPFNYNVDIDPNWVKCTEFIYMHV